MYPYDRLRVVPPGWDTCWSDMDQLTIGKEVLGYAREEQIAKTRMVERTKMGNFLHWAIFF